MRATLSQSYDQQRFETLINSAHESSGYSLREITRLTGFNTGYVCQILNGQRHPSRDTLIALCTCGWILSLDQVNTILSSAGYKPLSSLMAEDDRLLID